MKPANIAVASRSFSKNPILRSELLQHFPSAVFNESGTTFKGAELVAFLKGKQAALIGLELINDELLSALPELKVISKYGVGLDNLDLAALEKRKIRLGWTAGVNRRAVAELALSFALILQRGTWMLANRVARGEWPVQPGNNLSEKTVGIVGFGHIGTEFAKLLSPFNCRILVNDILDKSESCSALGAKQVSLETLLSESDIVSLHLPFTELTKGLIGKTQLSWMKPSSILLNTARGGLVDEVALEIALTSGALHAAGFDVFAMEPPGESPLLKCPRFIGTPHIGGGSHEAILAMGRAAIDRLRELL